MIKFLKINTKVVHCRKKHDVYIGRPSKWGNPFFIGKDGSRQEVIDKYEKYILSRPDLLADLHELRGKTLGCWCKPKLCHGDILAKLADSLGVDDLGEMTDYYDNKAWAGARKTLAERMKEANEAAKPLELAEEIYSCVDSLYSETTDTGMRKLPDALSDYAGYISVAHRQSKLLIEKLAVKTVAGVPEPIKKIAQVTFAGNNEVRYDFFTDLDLKVGEDVVCHTVRGFGIGRVVGFVDTSTKARDWIVQQVDVERYKALVERDREAREIDDMLG